jgi:tape measure domain-containing protein
MKDVGATLRKTGFAFNGLFSKATMIVGIFQQIMFTAGLLGGALIALAVNVYGVYVEISSLQIALANTIKDGTSAADVFNTLVDIANRTGAGIDSLARNFSGLNTIIRNTGSTTYLLDLLSSLTASVGGTSGDLDRLLVNFRQVLSMGRLTGDEFKEIAAILPQFSEGLINAFGTVDTEKLSEMGLNANDVIKGAVAELAKMSVVLDSPRLGVERLKNAFMMFKFKIGEIMHENLGPFISVLTKFLNYVSKPEIFNKIFRNFRGAFRFDKMSVISFFATLLAYIEVLPDVLKNLKDNFVKWFDFLANIARWLARVYAAILGVKILQAFWPLIAAAWLFAKAIWQGVAGIAAIKAMASRDIKQLAQDLLIIAGAIVGVIALEQLMSEQLKPPTMPGANGVDFNDMVESRRRAMIAEFSKTDTAGMLDPNAFNLDNAIGGATGEDLLADIADNTLKTANILQESLQKIIMGGSNVAAKGISARQVDSIKHGVTNSLVEGIRSYVEDTVEEVMYKHLQRARVVT